MADLVALALPLADAAEEGRKVITAMLITGLVLVALPLFGELYMYFRYHRRGRLPH
jgi:hypothetical protein